MKRRSPLVGAAFELPSDSNLNVTVSDDVNTVSIDPKQSGLIKPPDDPNTKVATDPFKSGGAFDLAPQGPSATATTTDDSGGGIGIVGILGLAALAYFIFRKKK